MTATTYVPEKPCKRGHFLRYAKSGICVPCVLVAVKEWRSANPEKCAEYGSSGRKKAHTKLWRANNRARHLRSKRLHTQRLKLSVMTHYGGCKCARCGISDIDVLSVDHIDNSGSKHRLEVPASRIYQWLKRNNFPPGFQVLCMNCNLKKEIERKRALYQVKVI
jgi:hypothetical protein